MADAPPSAAARPSPGPMSGAALAIVFLYAAAMGWLEAVVVVYLRALIGYPHGGAVPEPPRVFDALHGVPWLIPTEQTREAATLVMLAAVGWLAGRTARQRVGAFLVSFGAWDIVYYVALHALVHWPENLGTRDVLFLIPPHPWWYQPVAVPVAISCAMIVVGVRLARAAAR